MSYDTEARGRTLPHLIRRIAFLLVAVLACLRLAHIHLLWADEDYHLAAAIDILHGKVPYCDFWYDKPPLAAFYYLLIGGHDGWPLRLLDSGYVLLACWLAYRLARTWWGEAEGVLAAVLLSFSMAFYLPSAVIAFAADAVMIVPHLAAVYCAFRGRALAAGVLSGIAFLANPKGLFVLATCAAWIFPSGLFEAALGFAIPVLIAVVAAAFTGAWAGYVEQVWHWGILYSKGTPVANPLRTGLVRTADWAAFQSSMVVGAVFAFPKLLRSDRWKLGVWIVFSFAGVALGGRFAPHYYLQLLPPLVIAGAHGMVLAWQRYRAKAAAVFVVLALIPVVRFGPRYVSLTADNLAHRAPRWNDVALDEDSRQVAAEIAKIAKPGDTLLVWGYRPDVYVYTRRVSDSRFWDSQPLTGVPADRHLTSTTSIYSAGAEVNRRDLARTQPMFLVDGLGLMNPRLAPGKYPELRDWLAHYKVVARTPLSLIYKRVD